MRPFALSPLSLSLSLSLFHRRSLFPLAFSQFAHRLILRELLFIGLDARIYRCFRFRMVLFSFGILSSRRSSQGGVVSDNCVFTSFRRSIYERPYRCLFFFFFVAATFARVTKLRFLSQQQRDRRRS